MKGKRIFDRFGFNLSKSVIKPRPQAKLISNFEDWVYDPEIADWVNTSTAEVLTGFKVPSHLQAILSNNLNDSIC